LLLQTIAGSPSARHDPAMLSDIPRLSGGNGRAAFVDVAICALEHAAEAGPDIVDVTVRDHHTGRHGMLRATALELLTAISECRQHELIQVPVDRIAWMLRR